MKYKSFDELYKHHKENRSEMSFEEELLFVEDCFDTMEGLGFNETFNSPYDEHSSYNGCRFTVKRRLSYIADDFDLEVLPAWKIILENGTEMEAYPEEIFPPSVWESRAIEGTSSDTADKKIKTFEFIYEGKDGFGSIQFCSEDVIAATRMYEEWCEENGHDCDFDAVEIIWLPEDAEEYGNDYFKEEKK